MEKFGFLPETHHFVANLCIFGHCLSAPLDFFRFDISVVKFNARSFGEIKNGGQRAIFRDFEAFLIFDP